MITASLVLYKSKVSEVKRLLECVEKSIIDKVYVIDNSPSDDLKKIVIPSFSKAEYFFGHGNVGYGKAHNEGMKKAGLINGVYHIVLNPDIYFESEIIREISDFMDRHDDVGLLLPKVIYPNGELQYLCKLLPTPLDIFGRRLLPESMIKHRNDRFEMRQMGYDKVWNCPILSGCFMFLRLSDVEKTGGFDDRFFMYFEDFDLMRRLHKVCKTVYFPKVTIVHNHAAEHHTNRALLKASIQSAIKYFNKWGWVIDLERYRVNKKAFDEINHISDN